MTCSCPKCAAQVQVDLSHIPEEGNYTPCPECNKRFWTQKDTFAKKILKKEGTKYCAKCSSELGPFIVCTGCGVTFPDYYAVLAAKPARRQLEKAGGFSLTFSPRQVKQSYAVHHTVTTRSKKSVFPKFFLLVVAAVLLVGAGLFYQNLETEQQYAANFARALYGIKMGTELSINVCTKISADWKTKTDADRSPAPRVSPADEPRLNTIQDELDRIMQKLNKPPQKFVKANEKLAGIYGAYTKLHSLALAPSGSLAGFSGAANNAEANYRQAVQDLKTDLPAELSKELEKAKKKYKGLQDF
jgi:hypothetical protein